MNIFESFAKAVSVINGYKKVNEKNNVNSSNTYRILVNADGNGTGDVVVCRGLVDLDKEYALFSLPFDSVNCGGCNCHCEGSETVEEKTEYKVMKQNEITGELECIQYLRDIENARYIRDYENRKTGKEHFVIKETHYVRKEFCE